MITIPITCNTLIWFSSLIPKISDPSLAAIDDLLMSDIILPSENFTSGGDISNKLKFNLYIQTSLIQL